LEITEVAQIFGLVFLHGKRYALILTKNGLGNTMWRFFYELILSPWLQDYLRGSKVSLPQRHAIKSESPKASQWITLGWMNTFFIGVCLDKMKKFVLKNVLEAFIFLAKTMTMHV
jgi:hypothetical protein